MCISIKMSEHIQEVIYILDLTVKHFTHNGLSFYQKCVYDTMKIAPFPLLPLIFLPVYKCIHIGEELDSIWKLPLKTADLRRGTRYFAACVYV